MLLLDAVAVRVVLVILGSSPSFTGAAGAAASAHCYSARDAIAASSPPNKNKDKIWQAYTWGGYNML